MLGSAVWLTFFKYGIDLASPMELIAYGKTRQEIAKLIDADELIYQDLDDLRDACIEAAPTGEVKEFEVGVFNGEYKTPVPQGYLEHLSKNRGNKRRVNGNEGSRNGTLIGNSGPVNTASSADAPNGDRQAAAHRCPENREDIRYVLGSFPQADGDGKLTDI